MQKTRSSNGAGFLPYLSISSHGEIAESGTESLPVHMCVGDRLLVWKLWENEENWSKAVSDNDSWAWCLKSQTTAKTLLSNGRHHVRELINQEKKKKSASKMKTEQQTVRTAAPKRPPSLRHKWFSGSVCTCAMVWSKPNVANCADCWLLSSTSKLKLDTQKWPKCRKRNKKGGGADRLVSAERWACECFEAAVCVCCSLQHQTAHRINADYQSYQTEGGRGGKEALTRVDAANLTPNRGRNTQGRFCWTCQSVLPCQPFW